MIKTRYIISLLLASSVLAACSDTWDYVNEKYTGERRGEVVGGPRRAPMLNPKGAKIEEPKTTSVAAIAAPKALTPFDQYDSKGNEVKTEGTNILQAWLGGDEPAKPAARRPFKGLQFLANEVSQAAPLPPAPIVEAEASAPPAPIVTAPNKAPLATDHHPRIQFKDEMDIPEEENGVIVPIERQKRSEQEIHKAFAQLQPSAGGDSAAPHLSDVPKKPAALDDVAKDKDSALQELELEHDKAMEEKERLLQEPSELKPVTLPQVRSMLHDITVAIKGKQPIVTAAN